MDEEKILLDQEGYNQFLNEIEKVKEDIRNNSSKMSDAFENCGDGFHDNFAFEELNREDFRLKLKLKALMAKRDKIVIIEKKENMDDDLANIGDLVIIELTYNNEEPELIKVLILASDGEGLQDDIVPVTINSPLGKELYQNKVGGTGSYNVNQNVVKYLITQIIKARDLGPDGAVLKRTN